MKTNATDEKLVDVFFCFASDSGRYFIVILILIAMYLIHFYSYISASISRCHIKWSKEIKPCSTKKSSLAFLFQKNEIVFLKFTQSYHRPFPLILFFEESFIEE